MPASRWQIQNRSRKRNAWDRMSRADRGNADPRARVTSNPLSRPVSLSLARTVACLDKTSRASLLIGASARLVDAVRQSPRLAYPIPRGRSCAACGAGPSRPYFLPAHREKRFPEAPQSRGTTTAAPGHHEGYVPCISNVGDEQQNQSSRENIRPKVDVEKDQNRGRERSCVRDERHGAICETVNPIDAGIDTGIRQHAGAGGDGGYSADDGV